RGRALAAAGLAESGLPGHAAALLRRAGPTTGPPLLHPRGGARPHRVPAPRRAHHRLRHLDAPGGTPQRLAPRWTGCLPARARPPAPAVAGLAPRAEHVLPCRAGGASALLLRRAPAPDRPPAPGGWAGRGGGRHPGAAPQPRGFGGAGEGPA